MKGEEGVLGRRATWPCPSLDLSLLLLNSSGAGCTNQAVRCHNRLRLGPIVARLLCSLHSTVPRITADNAGAAKKLREYLYYALAVRGVRPLELKIKIIVGTVT